MGTITRKEQFVSDVRDAYLFIAADSIERAEQFVRDMHQQTAIISDNPHLGPARFPKHPQMRLFPFRRYLIVYQPIAEVSGIDLIRLLYSARDYHRYFQD